MFVINNNVMETIIVHPKNNEEQKVIKAFLEALKIKFKNGTSKSEDTYNHNQEFDASEEKSIQIVKKGKSIKVNFDDIEK